MDKGQWPPAYTAGDYLTRHPDNPIITPDDIPGGAATVFNSGFALYGDEVVGLVHVWDRQWIPRFYLGRSRDGVHFEIDTSRSMAEPPHEYPYVRHEGIFDSRITEIEGVYYVTCNVASRLGGRIMLYRTEDFAELTPLGFIAGPDHRNCALFPERIGGHYVRLERPMGDSPSVGDIYISYSPDLMFWGKSKLLLEKNTRYWESAKIGTGAPPLKTDEGWLVIYHACRLGMNGYIYQMGCMLLDLDDPSRIRGKMNECLFSPREYYECVGVVGNVVFPTAALRHGGPDELKVYYGAADTCVALATGSISRLVQMCLDSPVEPRS